MTDKIDFTKTLDSYVAKHGEFRVVAVPEMTYIIVDGHGDPNTSPAYAERPGYPPTRVAYARKFANKLDQT
jgi:hypothetical protein